MILRTVFVTTLALSFTQSAQASTTDQFVPVAGIAVIVINSMLPQTDADAITLYQALNVPEDNEGPGAARKGLTSDDKRFELKCRYAASQSTAACTFTLRPGENSKLDFGSRHAKYTLGGNAARKFFEHFFPSPGQGVFDFKNAEGTLRLRATPEQFELVYR